MQSLSIKSGSRLYDCAIIIELTVEGENLSEAEAKELAARSLWAFVGRYSMPEIEPRIICMEKTPKVIE